MTDTTNQTMPELLPCPFCGGSDLELHNTHTASFWVNCNDCDAKASGEYYKGPQRETRFCYRDQPQCPFEANFESLHPEYQKAALSAIAAWNRRALSQQDSAPLPDVLQALSKEFASHPQLKGVIGREALILRCVDAAVTAPRVAKEKA